MIQNDRGRPRSVRTAAEDLALIDASVTRLSPEEAEVLKVILDEMEKGETTLWDAVTAARYRWRPVSMEQFLDDPYYLGESTKTLFPKIRADMIELFGTSGIREVILTGSLGFGKCLAASAEIYDVANGRRVTMAEAANMKLLDGVASFDKSVVARPAVATVSGMKRMGWLRTSAGKKLRMSPDHPVLTAFGWKPIGDTVAGELIASARSIPAPARPLEISDSEVVFIAHMLAEGACSSANWSFTSASEKCLEEFKRVASDLSRDCDDDGDSCSLKAFASKARTYYSRGTQWIRRKYGLVGTSREKRVPASFYGLDDRQLALFLNRMWADDGCVSRGRIALVEMTLASEAMIRDVQMLLLRFGVHGRVIETQKSYKDKAGRRHWFDAWVLTITGAVDILKFFDAVGPIFDKEERCEVLCNRLRGVKHNTNVDVVPVDSDVQKMIREFVGPVRNDDWQSVSKGQNMGRDTFVRRLAERYWLPGWCSWWGDVLWDRVDRYEVDGDLELAYDLEVSGVANFVANGLIVHNSTSASIMMCRVLYEMSCLHSPQETYGLSRGSEIVLGLISKTLHLAQTVLMSAVLDKIQLSPYFLACFPPTGAREVVHFPNNVILSVGSVGSERMLGANVFAAVLDEANFMSSNKRLIMSREKKAGDFDAAEKIFTSISMRLKSRFLRAGGDMPGVVALVSSATSQNSFIERRIAEARRYKDTSVFVRNYALWHVKPKHNYCGKTFRVVVGANSHRSRIVNDGDVVDELKLEAEDAQLIEVPVEYFRDFDRDLENAIRDIAGMSTTAVSPFIHRSERIDMCVTERMSHPFTQPSWRFGDAGFATVWERIAVMKHRRLPGGFTETYWVPKNRPDASRWVHIDTSLTSDCTGIAWGYIDRWVEVTRRTAEGDEYHDTAPYVVIEAMLQVIPQWGEEIEMAELRALLYALQEHGFVLAGFSSDLYQSADMHQQMRKRVHKCEIISMDTSTAPYELFRSMIYEGRVEYYGYGPLLKELKALEYNREVAGGKIDHPPAGEKDTADAVAGVCFGLSKHGSRQPMPVAEFQPDDEVENDNWVRGGPRSVEAPKPIDQSVPEVVKPVTVVGARAPFPVSFDE